MLKPIFDSELIEKYGGSSGKRLPPAKSSKEIFKLTYEFITCLLFPRVNLLRASSVDKTDIVQRTDASYSRRKYLKVRCDSLLFPVQYVFSKPLHSLSA